MPSGSTSKCLDNPLPTFVLMADGVPTIRALTSLDISANSLVGEIGSGEYEEDDGFYSDDEVEIMELDYSCVVALADGIKNSGALEVLDISNNALCGINKRGRGTYDASGVTALADAIGKHE